MRQILSFVFVGLFAGCHGSENPVVSPDDVAGDAMASDSSANAAKMTVSAGTAGGGSNRQVPRSHKARELVSATTNAGGLTLSSGTAGATLRKIIGGDYVSGRRDLDRGIPLLPSSGNKRPNKGRVGKKVQQNRGVSQ